jgi:hypothetical protein
MNLLEKLTEQTSSFMAYDRADQTPSDQGLRGD